MISMIVSTRITIFFDRYKPGRLDVAPLFCLPHQPRLDWQMWFAALGNYQSNPWLISLVWRILEGNFLTFIVVSE